jgi:predicted metal-dependent peptidase
MDLTNFQRKDEFYSIMQELSIFHSVFLALWKMGEPYFSNEIATAAVRFDKHGRCLQFLFNPEFWDECNNYKKSFVIAHECLHVILDHGKRSKKTLPELANCALDVAVNHMLVNNFGFEKNLISDWEKYCWVDTVFKYEIYGLVGDDKNFEYYYDLLSKNIQTFKRMIGDGSGSFQSVDDHSQLPDEIKDILEELNDALPKAEADDFDDKTSGDHPDGGGLGHPGEPLVTGSAVDVFETKKQEIAKFWDKVLKDIDIKEIVTVQPQFAFKDRRMTLLDKKFMIPNEYENEVRAIVKPQIYLFLDCSGSCSSLRHIFFDLAHTIDHKKYDVKLFARTTQVSEMKPDKHGKYIVPYIGGSDDFRCIENYIQEELMKGSLAQYPAVVHFTDGGDCSGEIVKPQYPERWYWLLDGNHRAWIPKECKHVYNISQIV